MPTVNIAFGIMDQVLVKEYNEKALVVVIMIAASGITYRVLYPNDEHPFNTQDCVEEELELIKACT